MVTDDRIMQSCPHFNRCSAPLCALDTDLHIRDGWYVDEAICRHPDYQKHPMIRRQRRLARVAKRKKSADDEFHSVWELTETTAIPRRCPKKWREPKVAL